LSFLLFPVIVSHLVWRGFFAVRPSKKFPFDNFLSFFSGELPSSSSSLVEPFPELFLDLGYPSFTQRRCTMFPQSFSFLFFPSPLCLALRAGGFSPLSCVTFLINGNVDSFLSCSFPSSTYFFCLRSRGQQFTFLFLRFRGVFYVFFDKRVGFGGCRLTVRQFLSWQSSFLPWGDPLFH